MAKSEDLAHDRRSAPLDVTRRQFLPLLGATAASAIVLPRSLAATPADASPPALKALRLCRHLHLSGNCPWRHPSKPGQRYLRVPNESE